MPNMTYTPEQEYIRNPVEQAKANLEKRFWQARLEDFDAEAPIRAIENHNRLVEAQAEQKLEDIKSVIRQLTAYNSLMLQLSQIDQNKYDIDIDGITAEFDFGKFITPKKAS